MRDKKRARSDPMVKKDALVTFGLIGPSRNLVVLREQHPLIFCLCNQQLVSGA